MKCLLDKRSGRVVKVSNEAAASRVAEDRKRWAYTNKAAYRRFVERGEDSAE